MSEHIRTINYEHRQLHSYWDKTLPRNEAQADDPPYAPSAACSAVALIGTFTATTTTALNVVYSYVNSAFTFVS